MAMFSQAEGCPELLGIWEVTCFCASGWKYFTEIGTASPWSHAIVLSPSFPLGVSTTGALKRYQCPGPSPDQVMQIFRDWLRFLEFLKIFPGISEPQRCQELGVQHQGDLHLKLDFSATFRGVSLRKFLKLFEAVFSAIKWGIIVTTFQGWEDK